MIRNIKRGPPLAYDFIKEDIKYFFRLSSESILVMLRNRDIASLPFVASYLGIEREKHCICFLS